MQEIVLKSYRKLQNFLGGSIYDLAPPLLNTLRGPCRMVKCSNIWRSSYFEYVRLVKYESETFTGSPFSTNHICLQFDRLQVIRAQISTKNFKIMQRETSVY